MSIIRKSPAKRILLRISRVNRSRRLVFKIVFTVRSSINNSRPPGLIDTQIRIMPINTVLQFLISTRTLFRIQIHNTDVVLGNVAYMSAPQFDVITNSIGMRPILASNLQEPNPNKLQHLKEQAEQSNTLQQPTTTAAAPSSYTTAAAGVSVSVPTVATSGVAAGPTTVSQPNQARFDKLACQYNEWEQKCVEWREDFSDHPNKEGLAQGEMQLSESRIQMLQELLQKAVAERAATAATNWDDHQVMTPSLPSNAIQERNTESQAPPPQDPENSIRMDSPGKEGDKAKRHSPGV